MHPTNDTENADSRYDMLLIMLTMRSPIQLTEMLLIYTNSVLDDYLPLL